MRALAEYLAGLQFDPWSPDTLYMLTYQVVEDVGTPGVYRSKDEGATWENITGELAATAYVSSLVTESAPGGTLLAATPQGLFKWVPQGD